MNQAVLLHAELKGFPADALPVSGDALAERGWHVLGREMSYPLATLSRSAVAHNLAWMQAYARRKGVWLAPHAKTTLSPELCALQLAAGAWGLTLANVHQVPVGLAAGAQRLLIANQVLAWADLGALDQHLREHPALRIWFLVDSLEQLAQIEAWQRDRRSTRVFDVLLEVGQDGQRTGCRSLAQALALARALAASPAVRLGGVECYEGGLAQGESAQDSAAVTAFVQRAVAVARACDAEDLLDGEPLLLSAGGSAVFDLVMPLLQLQGLKHPVQGLLRSGCYITHDHLRYARFLHLVEQREGLDDSLRPALAVWTLVQSVPEPGLALLTAGRRDVSFDTGLPLPIRHALHDSRADQATPAHWHISALNDQHAYLRFAPDSPAHEQPRVGDRVALGISHPCTTFDKWRWLAWVEDDGRITGAVSTRF